MSEEKKSRLASIHLVLNNAVEAPMTATPAPPASINRELANLPRNDDGNGQRLLRRYGDDIVYVEGVAWHVWDGKRWRPSLGQRGGPGAEVIKCAHLAEQAIRNEAEALEMDAPAAGDAAADWAKRVEGHYKFGVGSGNAGKIDAMLWSAAPYKRRRAEEMDAGRRLLNVANGTLVLAAPVEMRPAKKADFMTRTVAVTFDREAPAPLWRAFLDRVLPDREIQEFLQRWFGYCLTGEIGEQCLVVMHGAGANGKSTLIEAVAYVLGDYAISLPVQTFAHDDRRRGGEATPDLARLPGVRFVRVAEPDVGTRLSESLVKVITGGERITARALYESMSEFPPQFKLVVAANVKPSIRGQDEGIWRRIRLVPFEVQVPAAERDPHLGEKLKAEASGILNWLVDGFRLWHEGGLTMPEGVRVATADYRAESDAIGEFLRGCTRPEPGRRVKAAVLYALYGRWAAANAVEPVSLTLFGRRLGDLGVRREKSSVTYYCDLAIDEQAAAVMEGEAAMVANGPTVPNSPSGKRLI